VIYIRRTNSSDFFIRCRRDAIDYQARHLIARQIRERGENWKICISRGGWFVYISTLLARKLRCAHTFNNTTRRAHHHGRCSFIWYKVSKSKYKLLATSENVMQHLTSFSIHLSRRAAHISQGPFCFLLLMCFLRGGCKWCAHKPSNPINSLWHPSSAGEDVIHFVKGKHIKVLMVI
jgi:hypothetical protein